MFNWLFNYRKKKLGSGEGQPARGGDAPRPAASRAAATAATPVVAARPTAPAAPAVDWSARLAAAQGDDAALLALAQATTVLDVKIAAVQGLVGEAALRQAERELRNRDRKAHKLAKQRLEAVVAEREARSAADALLLRAADMLAVDLVALNQVTALDRAWQALPAARLTADQSTRYAHLRGELDQHIRTRSDALQRAQRWLDEVREPLQAWPQTADAIARLGRADELQAVLHGLAQLADSRPADAMTEAHAISLAQAQSQGAELVPHLAWFEAASALPAGQHPEVSWSTLALPSDVSLARTLAQRHQRWLAGQQPAPMQTAAGAPADAAVAAPARAPRPPRPAPAAALSAEQLQQADELLRHSQAALDEGHVNELQQRLTALDGVLGAAGPGGLKPAQRSQLQTLRGEVARLKGWQQWGGGRARDELVEEAEALARQVQPARPGSTAEPGTVDSLGETGDAAATPDAAGTPGPAQGQAQVDPGPDARPHLVKFDVKALRESIHGLRMRWKELDKLGAPGGQGLWQRFDAALQQASEPVAAHHAALAASRHANLASRIALLDALDGLAVPDPAASSVEQRAAFDWKALVHELGNFQTAWRKLGPVEHTVPVDARVALQQRHRAALDRVEQPLAQARKAAQLQREQLITQAEVIRPAAAGGAGGPPRAMAESARLVRALQADWQEQARRLPLPRVLETELWTRFKAATDAVFAQRDAAFAARDAEQAANLDACEALLRRLTELGADTPRAEVERTLAEVDRAWRDSGELPRGALDRVERRYRAARAAAVDLLDAAERRRWLAVCDLLVARLSLCDEREAGPGASASAPVAGLAEYEPAVGDASAGGAYAGDASAGDESAGVTGALASAGVPPTLEQRWLALGRLPAHWDAAFATRWESAQRGGSGALAAAAVDDLLLQLEAALDLPASGQRAAERRALKLRELKDTMEGRRASPGAGSSPGAAALLTLLGQADLGTEQRDRLHAVLAALRHASPGALGLPRLPG
ncbi:MAG: hypothetical protein RIQ60_2127 [Pseudomonadota bacterium]|jgi:hypothetical protein